MSASATSNTKPTEGSIELSDAEDIKMFQAAKRTGRRNALGDLSEHFTQIDTSIPSMEVDKMAPHFQSMSIKN